MGRWGTSSAAMALIHFHADRLHWPIPIGGGWTDLHLAIDAIVVNRSVR